MTRRKGSNTGIPGLSFSWKQVSGLLMLLMLFLMSVALAQPASWVTENNQTQLSLKKTVGIFIEAPSPFEIQENTKNILARKTQVLFPANKFYVLPLDITSNALASYQPTNHIANVYKNKHLMREDIQTIAKDLNCDYALFITIEKGLPSMSTNFNSATYTTSILCDMRLLNVKNNSYIAKKQITSDTSSDAFKAGRSSYDNAYSDALAQALMEFNLDASSL